MSREEESIIKQAQIAARVIAAFAHELPTLNRDPEVTNSVITDFAHSLCEGRFAGSVFEGEHATKLPADLIDRIVKQSVGGPMEDPTCKDARDFPPTDSPYGFVGFVSKDSPVEIPSDADYERARQRIIDASKKDSCL